MVRRHDGVQLGGTWYLLARIAEPPYRLILPLDAAGAAEYWDDRPVGPVVIQGPPTLGDPRQAVVAQIGAGLAVSYALFGVEGCEIVTFAQPDGLLPDLWQLGSPAHTDVPSISDHNQRLPPKGGPPSSHSGRGTREDRGGEGLPRPCDVVGVVGWVCLVWRRTPSVTCPGGRRHLPRGEGTAGHTLAGPGTGESIRVYG